MQNYTVSIVRYERPRDSVRHAVALCGGFGNLTAATRVFIKPNIVFWTKTVPFPKWGVITTTRVVEDVIGLLKAHGVSDITVGEGTVTMNPRDLETPAHAFKTLGYDTLQKKYGIKVFNIFERPFKKLDLGGGVELRFNRDALESDLVVDLPVMKCHNQTMISLGIKNLKGLIDIPSRKKCHNMTPGKDLHFWVSKLADPLPPVFTLIDGIYSCERGPGPDGKMHRSDILVASPDILSADLVGARLLGHDPADVPHLVHAAQSRQRPLDLSDIDLQGEALEPLVRYHEFDFGYQSGADAELPVPMVKQGLKGIYYRKYDLSMCTYCSGVNGIMLSAIRFARKDKPWDKIEVLTGKSMQPTPGMEKTILLGKCMYQAHKDNPDIKEAIAVKGCPPKPADMVAALHKAGIDADPGLFENIDQMPGFFMSRYEDRPEFQEEHFRA